VAEHRAGALADRGAELRVDSLERLAHVVDPRARGAAAAVDERVRDATPAHLVGDLLPGAVHDDDLVALLGEAEDPARRLARDRAADLHDEARHERYSALIRT